MQNEQHDFWFYLSFMANVAQLYDLQLNLGQTNNDQIMKHLLEQDDILDKQNKVLEQQDRVLDLQTNVYLKQIVEQNQTIIDLLKGGK